MRKFTDQKDNKKTIVRVKQTKKNWIEWKEDEAIVTGYCDQ